MYAIVYIMYIGYELGYEPMEKIHTLNFFYFFLIFLNILQLEKKTLKRKVPEKEIRVS